MSAGVAIVLGLGSTGLAAVRSLARRGIEVIGASWSNREYGRHSRLCRVVTLADPTLEPELFLNGLCNILKQAARPVAMLPTSDAVLQLLCASYHDLPEDATFCTSPPDLVRQLLDKRRQDAIAREAGIPRPATCSPLSDTEAKTFSLELSYPVFVKPSTSYLRGTQLPGKGFVAFDAAAFAARVSAVLAEGIVPIAESIIPGPVENLYSACVYLARDGSRLGGFVQRKMRQGPNDFGVGTLVESVNEEGLLDLAQEFCRVAQYTGMAEIEFKLDSRDGQFRFIEMNPRLWEQTSLAMASGVDFPWLLWQDLHEEGISPSLPAKIGKIWWDAWEDLYAFREQRKQGDSTIATWLRQVLNVRVHPSFAWNDPAPLAYEVASRISNTSRALARKLFHTDGRS